MLEYLKEEVLKANLQLPKHHLVTLTWGNVSAIDREANLIAIKPSGIDYTKMTLQDIVLVDLQGNIIEGTRKPSSDLMTHLVIYKHFLNVGGIVHTHSRWATIFAQAGLDIPALGTTMADYFYGNIPCTRCMKNNEIQGEYERQTGNVIIETFDQRNLNEKEIPGVLVHSHGPFTWGRNAHEALQHAIVLEECAMMACLTKLLNEGVDDIQQVLLERHFKRKHGVNAYYGQSK